MPKFHPQMLHKLNRNNVSLIYTNYIQNMLLTLFYTDFDHKNYFINILCCYGNSVTYFKNDEPIHLFENIHLTIRKSTKKPFTIWYDHQNDTKH